MTGISPQRSQRALLLAGLGGVIIGGAAVALAKGAMFGGDRAGTEAIVHDYILNHPEILPEAMKRLQARETSNLVGTHRLALETPFQGAWAGAPKGDVTLVMFTDYSCGFCRASVADVDRLLATDRKLKVVWREIPILGPGSEAAARVALAAAGQGRYLDFHRRMFAAGAPDPETLARVQKQSRVAPVSFADKTIQQELETNLSLARALGLTGTPTFVIGDRILQGAVGYQALKDAVEEARKTPSST